jgi:hypothetical protein
VGRTCEWACNCHVVPKCHVTNAHWFSKLVKASIWHVSDTWQNQILIERSMRTGFWLDNPGDFLEISGLPFDMGHMLSHQMPRIKPRWLVRTIYEAYSVCPVSKSDTCNFPIGPRQTTDWFVRFCMPLCHDMYRIMPRELSWLVYVPGLASDGPYVARDLPKISS